MHDLDKADKEDLEEFLTIYRTAKRAGMFFVWVLGIAFTIVGLLLALKQLKQP